MHTNTIWNETTQKKDRKKIRFSSIFCVFLKRKYTVCTGTIHNVCAIDLGYGIFYDMHDNWTNEYDDDSSNESIDDVAIDSHV